MAMILGMHHRKESFEQRWVGDKRSSKGIGLWEDLLAEGDCSLGPWSWLSGTVFEIRIATDKRHWARRGALPPFSAGSFGHLREG